MHSRNLVESGANFAPLPQAVQMSRVKEVLPRRATPSVKRSKSVMRLAAENEIFRLRAGTLYAVP